MKSEIFIDKLRWKATFEGFLIRDCTLGCDENRMGFLLIQDLGDTHRENGWQTRFVSVKLDDPMETRFLYMTDNDLTTASLTSAWLPNQAQFVVADLAKSNRGPVCANRVGSVDDISGKLDEYF